MHHIVIAFATIDATKTAAAVPAASVQAAAEAATAAAAAGRGYYTHSGPRL